MFDLVKTLLRSGYYYARLMGLLNFEIDLRTGVPRITRRASIYAALVNLLTIAILPLLLNNPVVHLFWSRADFLHEYLFLAVLACRVVCLVATLICRWWQRPLYVRLINDFQRLAHRKPQVRRLWRRGIIAKWVSITLAEFFQMLIVLILIHEALTPKLIITVVILSTITAQVNVIVSQYYFALLNIHGHYILLNHELSGLLDEMHALETERRRGVFTIKCCALADQLDGIAAMQFQLQALAKQITSIFGLQIVATSASYYMSSVSLIYITFSELRTSRISAILSFWGRVVVVLQFLWYFIDIHITVNVTYAVQDVHTMLVSLVSQHKVFAAGLDERLEVALQNFQLQLAWNPMKIPVLGLYEMKKSQVVAMTSSVLSSSMVLVQYDLKHF
ncbi:hypothetical protein KR093_008298 [Drosophila rubida]|uniref:Gustatory receptor n=1 Tax=Drosophila rubida TaxID=30044 RepID=A0AAD4JT13_9MUSC|nr:hypothetical protein KR093_008298 [Drosophila rubida]